MPLPIVAAIGAGVGAAVSLASNLMAQGKRDEAARVLEQAAQEYGDVVYQEYQKANPQDFEVGQSAFAGQQEDPRLRDAQLRVLDDLDQIQDSGGLLMSDRAALNELNMDDERAASGRAARIRENMAMRGGLNSGAELASQLSNAQATANRRQQRALSTAGMAEQRVLDAMMQGGRFAGDVRGQDWGQMSDRARAADEIAKYNSGMRFRTFDANTGITDRQNRDIDRGAERKYRGAQDVANIRAGQAAQTERVGGAVGDAITKTSSLLDQDEDV